MNADQKSLCLQLIVRGPKAQRGVALDEFQAHFPTAINEGQLSRSILAEALENRDADELRCALIVGHTFGFPQSSLDLSTELIAVDWHQSHEDVVSALDKLGGPRAVDGLYHATQFVPQSAAYDEGLGMIKTGQTVILAIRRNSGRVPILSEVVERCTA